MLLLDEVRGHIADLLKRAMSDDRTVDALLRRAGGTSPTLLLHASLAVARKLRNQIDELESRFNEEIECLEDELNDLRVEVATLRRKPL
jgi:hypothetical protein